MAPNYAADEAGLNERIAQLESIINELTVRIQGDPTNEDLPPLLKAAQGELAEVQKKLATVIAAQAAATAAAAVAAPAPAAPGEAREAVGCARRRCCSRP